MKSILSIFLYMLLSQSIQGQILTPEQLRADFKRFRTALDEVHPEMYRYTPKVRFDSLFAATAAQLNHPMTQHAFYVTMVPLLVALRDGHIKWIVSGKDEHYPFFTDKLFPLKLYFVGNRAWVVGNYGTSAVPDGAELMAIDGKPTAAILPALLPNMTYADGDRIGGKLEDLNRYFSGYYATFVGAPDAFVVTYRVGGEERSVTLSPVTEETIKAYADAHKPAPQPPFRLSFADSRTAVMTIEQFAKKANGQTFKSLLRDAFRDIRARGIANLVLDLRDNEGGEESLGVLVYSYLAHHPFRYYDHISVRQKKRYSFPAWTSTLYRMVKWAVVRKRGDGYGLTSVRGLGITKPQKDAFKGKLYVLLNGNSFSVTTELAARVHADKRGMFIGQESGGGYTCNTSGLFAITQLPHSKIDLGIGMFGFNMANVVAYPHADRGIIPDHLVEPTVDDQLHHRDRVTPDRVTPDRVTPDRVTPDRVTPDRVMDYALRLIESEPSTPTTAASQSK